jgi:hypothetical protein
MRIRKIILLVLLTTLTALSTAALALDIGTMENPVPLGQSFQVEDWQVKVINVIPDATQMILDENMLNSKPETGNQYFMVTIEAKNVGNKERAASSLNLNAVGQSLIAYYPPFGLVVPNRIPSNDVFPGGTVKGNVAWEIASSDASSLVMYCQAWLSDEKIFWALK